jgi:enoyl-CoA hydratase
MAPTVKTERDGRVMTVTLDNPPRNFMTGAMVRELEELTKELEADASVGSVVITGAHPDSFVTHYDVGEILAGAEASPDVSPAVVGPTLRAVGAAARLPGAAEALERTPVAGLIEVHRIHELFLRMNRMDKSFVAAINGTATGGGCELALACDVRIAADGDHMIGQPEILLGLIPGGGGTQRLTRAVGQSRALELILEGRPLSPQEAEEIGLVHRVVPPERLLQEARSTAERLARRSPVAVQAAKRAVYEGSSRPLAQGLQVERTAFMTSAATPQAVRAMREYADQVDRLPDGVLAPAFDEQAREAWREGKAVDLTA